MRIAPQKRPVDARGKRLSQFTTLDFLGKPARQPAQEKNAFFLLKILLFGRFSVRPGVCQGVWHLYFGYYIKILLDSRKVALFFLGTPPGGSAQKVEGGKLGQPLSAHSLSRASGLTSILAGWPRFETGL